MFHCTLYSSHDWSDRWLLVRVHAWIGAEGVVVHAMPMMRVHHQPRYHRLLLRTHGYT